MTHDESDRTAEILRQYTEVSRCESCSRTLGSADGPSRPSEDCDSWEHEALWQAHRAEYWRRLAIRWRMMDDVLVEPHENLPR